jgi:DNA-binding XRE family transcriptional regulator
MANLAEVLKSEVSRLARKEVRTQTADMKRQSVAHRKAIAELRRQVGELERKVAMMEPKVLLEAPAPKADAGAEVARFSLKGLISQRKRLGFTAGEYGTLLGVSGQTVYNWESGKSRPRAKQVVAISEVRGLGKREANARLALLAKG